MKRYTDHAANERTWLAWIRTAIAIIAFGFIIERFELFSRYLNASLEGRGSEALLAGLNPLALLLVVAGVALIVFATVRFLHHQRMIEEDTDASYRSGPAVVALAALLVLIGLALAWMIL